MNRFTISTEFLDECRTNRYLLINVLFEFIQDNKYKVCLDDKGLILNSYKYCALELGGEGIRIFLEGLADKKNIDKISFDDSEQNIVDEAYFIELASHVPPERRLVVGSKQKYYDKYEDYIKNKYITILDGEETKQIIIPHTSVNISSGNNSPLTIGNNNQTKQR